MRGLLCIMTVVCAASCGRSPPAFSLGGYTFVVTTVADELDSGPSLSTIADAGGLYDVSLREALTLANNAGVPVTIGFDADLFPEDMPGRLVFDVSLGTMTITAPDVTLDARGYGVTVALEIADKPFLEITGDRARVLGLVLDEVYYPAIVLKGISGCELALNRWVKGDAGELARTFGVEASMVTSLVISDNAFDNLWRSIHVDSGTNVRIAKNRFRHGETVVELSLVDEAELVENELFGGVRHLVLESSSNIRVENNIMNTTTSTLIRVASASHDLRFSHNLISHCGQFFPAPYYHLAVGTSGATFSKNSVSSCLPGTMDIGANGDLEPPSVVSAGTTIQGTASHAVGGTVEVFTDPAAAAVLYLGSTIVKSDGTWSVVPLAPLTSGWNVSATVTDIEGNTSVQSTSVVVL